jgi:hypothetical protein
MERNMPRARIEEIIDEFNKDGTGWRLSLGAQNVIREIVLGLGTDDIGLVGLREPQQRTIAVRTALERLPNFLKELGDRANNITVDHRSGDERVIGAIYVTQNIGLWAQICPCWQREA